MKEIYKQLDAFVEKIKAETGMKSVMILVGDNSKPQAVDVVIDGIEENERTSFLINAMRNTPGVKFVTETGGIMINDPKMFGKDGWAVMHHNLNDLLAFSGRMPGDQSIPVFQMQDICLKVAETVGAKAIVPVKVIIDMDKKVEIVVKDQESIPSPYSGIVPPGSNEKPL